MMSLVNSGSYINHPIQKAGLVSGRAGKVLTPCIQTHTGFRRPGKGGYIVSLYSDAHWIQAHREGWIYCNEFGRQINWFPF
ncbi:hypothetical protein FKM82_031241 [Ascaphus truei]